MRTVIFRQNTQNFAINFFMVHMHVIAMFAIIATHKIFRNRLRPVIIKDFEVERIIFESIAHVVTANSENFLAHKHFGTAMQRLLSQERFFKRHLRHATEVAHIHFSPDFIIFIKWNNLSKTCYSIRVRIQKIALFLQAFRRHNIIRRERANVTARG